MWKYILFWFSYIGETAKTKGQTGLWYPVILRTKIYAGGVRRTSLRNKGLGGNLILIRGACLNKMIIHNIPNLFLKISASISSSLSLHCKLEDYNTKKSDVRSRWS